MNLKQHVADWSHCTRCPLWEYRRNVVHYRGDIPADIMLIGEAPGKSEDISGVPFDGPAGDKLDEILDEAFTTLPTRPTVCIANTIACIPIKWQEFSPGKFRRDGTRPPEKDEWDKCSPRMEELLALAKPKSIIAVGNIANGFLSRSKIDVAATIKHPAAILREGERTRYESFKRAALQIRKVATGILEEYDHV